MNNSTTESKVIENEIDLDTGELDVRSEAERSLGDRLRALAPDADQIKGFMSDRAESARARRERTKVRRRRFIKYRILPKSVLGTAAFLVAIAVGIAFSGASFYAYYNSRLTENEQAVGRFVEGFDQQFNDAAGALDELRGSSIDQIRSELEPLDSYVNSANGVVALPESVGESVWLLETRNSDGELMIGSAFAVAGHEGGTAMLTSLSLVSASSRVPTPTLEIVKDSERITAELWSWDVASDLALIVVEKPIEPLEMATNESQVASLGKSVFALSGVGGNGATAVPGVMVDSSRVGIQHTSPVGTLFEGGPIVDAGGRVLGMASTTYQPYGISGGAVGQSVDVQIICAQVLRCSETQGILAAEVAAVNQDDAELPTRPEAEEEVLEEDDVILDSPLASDPVEQPEETEGESSEQPAE